MRKLAIALAGAAALTFASAAQATVSINLGSTSVQNLSVVSNGDGSKVRVGFDGPSDTGMFTDTLSFHNTLSGLYNLGVSTDTGDTLIDFGQFFPSGCVTCGIFLSGTGIGSPIQLTLSSSADGLYTFAKQGVSLGVGDYTLSLNGYAQDEFSFYQGIVNFNAVPEPATWAMMLIGFGAIGASIRRRRTRVAVRQFA